MSSIQRLQWVALPSGASGADGLRVTVFVAPQLEPDGEGATLADFPELAGWAGASLDLSWEVALDNGVRMIATRVSPAPDVALWPRLFPPTLPVRRFAPDDPLDRDQATFSAAVTEDALRSAYAGTMSSAVRDAAPAPGDGLLVMAPADELPPPDLLDQLLSLEQHFAPLIEVFQGPAAGFDGPAADTPAGEFAKAAAFYDRVDREPDSGPADQADAADALLGELHQRLGVLADHPLLLRALGLVFDLEIPRDGPGLDSANRLCVLPRRSAQPDAAPGPTVVDSTPWTVYDLRLEPGQPLVFAAGSSAGGVIPGLLRLDERFRVTTVDLDGAIHQALALGAQLADGAGSGSVPPALRTGGLTLVQSGAADDLQASYRTTRANRMTDDLTFLAEDLVRGYRIDVLDTATATWRSLHRRKISYRLGDWQLEAEDEGFSHQTVVDSGGGRPTTYVHEALATWDGWSLSTPRPGRSIARQTTQPDGTPAPPVRPIAEPLAGLGLTAEATTTAGTLPRLRFGRSYRIRVRTVDLAGGGLDSAEADVVLGADPTIAERALSPTVRFLRFEPVGVPVVVSREVAAEGEDVLRLVLRTAGDPPATASATERILLAPKAPLEAVERHGRLDRAIDAGDSAERRRIYALAGRESGVMDDQVLTAWDGVELPWLPDPQAGGIALLDLPGVGGTVPIYLGFDQPDWHRPRPVTLRLVGTDRVVSPGPLWDEAEDRLTVALPPGRRMTVRMASKVADPDLMALMEWTEADWEAAGLPPDGFVRLRAAVSDSRHEMITPWQRLELVHAVQRPLLAPDFVTPLTADRRPDEAGTALSGRVQLDPESVDHLQLTAAWTETIDTGTGPIRSQSWTKVVREVSTAEALAADWRPGDSLEVLFDIGSPDARHSLGDTRHHLVTYQVEATSAYADFFPASYADPVVQDDALGTNRLTRRSVAVTVHVPSSSRPPAPQVLDVLPLIKRQSTPIAGPGDEWRLEAEREGGWIRITLGRPWFVTGEDERLAVIVAEAQPTAMDPRGTYVSALGQDPIRQAADCPPISVARLTGRRALTALDLELPEIVALYGRVGPPVQVRGFTPEFDEVGDRWYCDVRINAGQAYLPFVRLAVARLQEHSIAAPTVGLGDSPDAYSISPVVRLDAVQLLPDRRLRVTRTGKTVEITLTGPTYTGVLDRDGALNTGPEARARVTAVVQKRRPGAEGLLAWDDVWPTWRLDRRGDGWWTRGTLPNPDVSAYRMVIREEDRLPTDLTMNTSEPFASRTVYLEIIEF